MIGPSNVRPPVQPENPAASQQAAADTKRPVEPGTAGTAAYRLRQQSEEGMRNRLLGQEKQTASSIPQAQKKPGDADPLEHARSLRALHKAQAHALDGLEASASNLKAELEEIRDKVGRWEDPNLYVITTPGQLVDLKKDIKTYSDLATNRTAALEVLQTEHQQLRSQYDALQANVDSLKKKHKQSVKTNELLEQTIGWLTREAGKLRESLDNQHSALFSLVEEHDSLLGSFGEMRDRNAGLQAEAGKSGANLKKLQQQGMQKDERIGTLEEENAGLEKTVAAASSQVTQKDIEIAGLQKTIEDLKGQVDTHARQLKKESGELAAEKYGKGAAESRIRQLESALQAQQKKSGELQATVNRLEAEVDDKEAQIEYAAREQASMDVEIRAARDKLTELEPLQKKNEELTAKVDKAYEVNRVMMGSLEKATQEKSKALEDADAYKKQSERLLQEMMKIRREQSATSGAPATSTRNTAA